MYYLQSKYYNPEWRRFINADAVAGSVGELIGHNLFAYCKNNLVNMSDQSGFRPLFDDEQLQRDYSEYKRKERENKIRDKKVSKVVGGVSTASSYVSNILGTLFGSVMDDAYNAGDAATLKETFKWNVVAIIANDVIANVCYYNDRSITTTGKKVAAIGIHETFTVTNILIGYQVSEYLGKRRINPVIPVMITINVIIGAVTSKIENFFINLLRRK